MILNDNYIDKNKVLFDLIFKTTAQWLALKQQSSKPKGMSAVSK
jgi:hypothetical protein